MRNSDDEIRIEGESFLLNNQIMPLGLAGESLNEKIFHLHPVETFMPNDTDNLKMSVNNIPGISLYMYRGILNSISVVLPTPNDSRCFSGIISIDGHIIPKPFMTIQLEQLIPQIKIERVPSIYKDKYKPMFHNRIVLCRTELAFMTDRNSQYIGLISVSTLI